MRPVAPLTPTASPATPNDNPPAMSWLASTIGNGVTSWHPNVSNYVANWNSRNRDGVGQEYLPQGQFQFCVHGFVGQRREIIHGLRFCHPPPTGASPCPP